jgi:hypothetical protein
LSKIGGKGNLKGGNGNNKLALHYLKSGSNIQVSSFGEGSFYVIGCHPST